LRFILHAISKEKFLFSKFSEETKLSHDVAAMQGKESGTVGHILKAINFSRENDWTHNAESTKSYFSFDILHLK